MAEMGSVTLYVPENLRSSRTNSYAAFLNENNFTLLKPGKQENPGLLQGPRRVLRLCMFALVLPTVLIIIPLYVRLMMYPPGHYPMMPTDQRVLSKHVSSIWCQAQKTHMNGSFVTYQAPDIPPLKSQRQRHVMLHSTDLKDDIKEYWGFHLLEGSKVTISTCSSQDGAQLMILRGIENLKRCAWIGEEDSTEEEEEVVTIPPNGDKGNIVTFDPITKSGKIISVVTVPKDLREKSASQNEEAELLPTVEKSGKKASLSPTTVSKKGKKLAIQNVKEDQELESPETDLKINSKSSTINVTELLESLREESDKGQSDQPQPPSLEQSMADSPAYEDVSEERRQNLQKLLQKAMKISKSKKEILRILHSVSRGRSNPLPKNIRKIMGVTSDELDASPETSIPQRKKKLPKRRKTAAKTSSETKLRLTRSIDQDIEEYDGAFEEFDEDDLLNASQTGKNKNKMVGDPTHGSIFKHIFHPEGLKFERGKFNQTNRGDESNEEDNSSYSSSEEALASCSGVILTLPLVAYRGCSYKWTEMNKITYDIPITGTYYFVYSSDNEISTNTVYFNMTFEKVVYDIDGSKVICSNSTDCSVPLSFFSREKTVVEVPQEDTWSNSYTLDTTCEPRVAVYLTFLLLVPILILFCAFQ